MERIKEKPTSVLVPIIDVIEAKNFYYSTNGYDTFQVSDYCVICIEITSNRASVLVQNCAREKKT